MEASVIDLGNILNMRMEKIEKKLEELTSSVPSLPSKQELAELGSNVVGLNKSIGVAVTDIRTSCQKVSEVTVKLDKPEVELLTKTVVEKIVPAIQKECSQNLERINSSIDIMNKTTEEAKDCINKTNAEQKELKESLTGLPKLVKTLQSIIDNPATNVKISTQSPQQSSASPSSHPTPITKRMKGVVFTSSIGKGINQDKLCKELNSDVEILTTYFIEKNDSLTEPDAFLQQRIDQVMTSEYHFVIIQIGSNEMSQLDLKESKDKLFEKVQEDCDKVIRLAKSLVDNFDVEVFLSEKPPRYDDKVLESGGILEGLNNTSNSILHMRAHLLDRVNIIKQSMLESKSERVRNDRFSPDGLHLTEKGLGLLLNNWIDQVKKVFPDLQQNVSNSGQDGRVQQGPDQGWGGDRGGQSGGDRGQSGGDRGGQGGGHQRREDWDWGNSDRGGGRGRSNQGNSYNNRNYRNGGNQNRGGWFNNSYSRGDQHNNSRGSGGFRGSGNVRGYQGQGSSAGGGFRDNRGPPQGWDGDHYGGRGGGR